jgi:putative SOS response-associated peptidase YedK
MCARLTLTTTGHELADLFGLADDQITSVQKRYNIAPMQWIPVVRVRDGQRELVNLRWGLIPSWVRDPKPTGLVNARSETVSEKPSFREPFRHRRCLVPADGFYEWTPVGRKKQPCYFRKAHGGLMALAGLWDRWQGPEGVLETVTVLTVPANELIQPLHDRMPAILTPDQFAVWLDPHEHRIDRLLPLLNSYSAEQMECWPVHPRVNSATIDEPGLNQPLDGRASQSHGQPTLFDSL